MPNLNKVMLIGRLTRDPDLRYAANGLGICKLGLAVNRSWHDKSGEKRREETTFIDVDAFGKQAETLGQYLQKGKSVYVEGRLKLDSWEDKQTGQKRTKLGVALESFQFIDGGGESSGVTPRSQDNALAPSESTASASGDDDIPF